MSLRNLDAIFRPHSVALIGASERAHTVGRGIAENLLTGGFHGPLYWVNPRYETLFSRRCYRRIKDLPAPADLAIIATPARSVPKIIAELAAAGTRGAVAISAGLSPGSELLARTLGAGRNRGLRLVGPNCLGVINPRHGLNASFAHATPNAGGLAFVSQSGALATAVLDWATSRGKGFSLIASLGEVADVDFGDMLDYLAADYHTQAILLYIKSLHHARKFMSAARAASRLKPVIVVKGGRFESGRSAIAAHAGVMVGTDAVYAAAFHRAGMLRVRELQELFDAAAILGEPALIGNTGLAIVSNGGGMGVLAADALAEEGGELVKLAPSTLAALDQVLPASWSHANPIDITGDADGERYRATLGVLAADRSVGAALAIVCPTAIAPPVELAESIGEFAARHRRLRVTAAVVGGTQAEAARQCLIEHAVPAFETPEQAVRAFMYRIRHRRAQNNLMQTPPLYPGEFEQNPAVARSVIERGLDAGRSWLAEPDVHRILHAYGIATLPTRMVATPEEAAAAARRIGDAVVLKIASSEIVHKSDIGGVVLGLTDPDTVGREARRMLERVRKYAPDLEVEGFIVEPLAPRHGSRELMTGFSRDPVFGPVIIFGHGGTAAELVDDRALGLPPLDLHLAREQISTTRISRMLAGYGDIKAVDFDGLALALVRIGQIACDLPQIQELEINPLLASPEGVIALDARARIAPTALAPGEDLAIRPYPRELEEPVETRGGEALLLRPIRPEDEPAMQRLFARLSPEEIRLRFHHSLKMLDHELAARLTQIDYAREMALVLFRVLPATPEMIGVVRIACDPSNTEGEYAILIRRDYAGQGLGRLLMGKIVDYARDHGFKQIFGYVLAENIPMLTVCRRLGFRLEFDSDDLSVRRVRLDLYPA